jgi:phage tail P2-like protein
LTSLLPPNSTDLERKLAEAGKDAFDLPSIRIIKDIDQVPSQFLPFIAWQKSVDYWDENWQEALKRKVIKESRDLHRLKGTPAAIKKH